MRKNRNRLRGMAPGRASVIGTVENLLSGFLADVGPMSEIIKTLQEKNSIQERNRFVPLALKAYEERKFPYFSKLVQLSNFNAMWISVIDTPLGVKLIDAWKTYLKPKYDPADIECCRIPFWLPYSEKREFERTYRFMHELIDMRWAMMEGQFTMDRTKISILHVADIPLTVD